MKQKQSKVIIELPGSKTTLIVNKSVEELKTCLYGGSIVNRDPVTLAYETLESTTEKAILRNGHIAISAWNCSFVSLSEAD